MSANIHLHYCSYVVLTGQQLLHCTVYRLQRERSEPLSEGKNLVSPHLLLLIEVNAAFKRVDVFLRKPNIRYRGDYEVSPPDSSSSSMLTNHCSSCPCLQSHKREKCIWLEINKREGKFILKPWCQKTSKIFYLLYIRMLYCCCSRKTFSFV